MVDLLTFGVIAAVFIGVTLYLGYLGAKRTKCGDDFLLAGRNISPWIIGLSYGATFISTSAIIGFGGVAGQWGMGIIWLTVLNIGIGIMLAFIIFGKPIRRLGKKFNALTFPELLGKLFKSDFLRYSLAFVIVVGMPLYAAAVLIGGAEFLVATFEQSFTRNDAILLFSIITAIYVVSGGMRGVMYADAFQAALMLIGMAAIVVLTYLLLGGVTVANTDLTQMATVDNLVPAAWQGMGMTGWTSFPEFYSIIGLTMVTTIILGVGIGVLAQPQLVVRFMCAKDDRALNRAIPIGGIFIILTTGVAFTIGALSNVYFYYDSPYHQIAYAAAGNNRDAIMPLYINEAMPDIVIVVFMLTLLAAAMSTLSSQFHAMGSAAGYDMWTYAKRRLKRNATDGNEQKKASLRANQVGTGIVIVASVLLALSMPTGIIAIATALFMGLCAAAFLPALTHGLFSKRLSLSGAKLSLILGTLTWFLWAVFVHDKEAKILGICEELFGVPTLLGFPWSFVDPLVIAIPVSVASLAIGWLWDRHSGRLMPRPS